MSVHFRIAYGRVRSKHACGIGRWPRSMFLSSTAKPAAVTCGGCQRTNAYRTAQAAAGTPVTDTRPRLGLPSSSNDAFPPRARRRR